MKAISRLMCTLVLLAAPALGWCAAAVTVPGPERLPADTWMLVNWHGVDAATRVRATNPIMRFWDDPQFADVRELVMTAVTERLTADDGPLNRGKTEDAMSLLENPMVLGLTGDVLAGVTGGGQSMHMFVVLNKKGKEEAWSRLGGAGAQERPGREVSTYDFGGTQVTKTVTTRIGPVDPERGMASLRPRTTTSFEATLGDYVVHADEQQLVEALLTKLRQATPSGSSLRDSAVYQKALRHRAEGAVLDVFVKVPDLSSLPIPPMPPVDVATVIRELHLERVQGVSLSAGMARDRLQVNGLLLGDMTPGSLLDFVGSNVAELRTPAVAPASGIFNAIRLDLPALHATLLRAVKAGLPADQSAAASVLLDALVAAQTGMRLSDLLALFTGEVGMREAHLNEDLPGLFMLPVTNARAALDVVRTFAGGLVRGEESISGATVLTMGPPEGDPGVQVAVAPTMLVVAMDRALLPPVLSRVADGGTAPAGSLAADAGFRAERRSLPAQVNGISFTDFARLDWELLRDKLRQVLASGQPDAAPDADLNRAVDTVLALAKKHLKISAGASWKSADGWEFQNWLK